MSNELNIVLVGAAGLVAAPSHLNAYSDSPRIRLYGLCDTNSEKLHEIGHHTGTKHLFGHLDDVLSDQRVDAIDVVTPPATHAEIVLAAASAGKHIYCEKPMARSIKECQMMIDAARASNVRLMVGESYVFQGSHMLARKIIDDGSIGKIIQVRQTKGAWIFQSREAERLNGLGHHVAWRFDPNLSGGGEFPWMMDHGPHLFATAWYLARNLPIERVSALPRKRGVGGETPLRGISALTWLYEGGETDGIWVQTETPPEASEHIGFRTEVIGDVGILRVFGEGGGAAPGIPQPSPIRVTSNGKVREFDPNDGKDRSWVSNVNYYDRAHANALSHFAESVLDGSELRYRGEDGKREVATTLAAIKSAIDGQSMTVNEVPGDWTAYT